MCLAVPMEIIDLLAEDRALVRQGSISLEADLSLLENPKVGDFVIVHAGYAIETLDPDDAEDQIDIYSRLQEGPPSAPETL